MQILQSSKLSAFSVKKPIDLIKHKTLLIKDKIEIVETDEIHQGRNGIAIACVDKKSTYFLSIKKINDKSVDTISSYLNETLSANKDLQVIITDGLSSYKDALKRMSEKVTHIMCHVHVYRAVMKELESYIRVRNKKYKRVKDACEKVEFIQKQLRTRKKSLSYYSRKLEETLRMRDAYYKKNGIKKYAKKTYWSKERICLSKRLNFIRSYIRSKKKSIESLEAKLSKSLGDLSNFEAEYNRAKLI